MNRASSLAAERPYIRLCREDHDARIAEAVRTFDQKIDCSPVGIGETERFPDPYQRGRVTFLTRLLGGEEVIVIIPLRAETNETFRAARELAETVMAELEPAPTDD